MVVLELLGIFVGNCLWVSGVAAVAAGVWLLRATPESVLKLVGFLSLAGPGNAEKASELLTRLVRPVDRTTRSGALAIVVGLAGIGLGCLLIKLCA